MERESMVQEVSVEFDGETYTAAYFVEGNTIHANLQGRILLFPVGNVAPASIVKAVFTGQLMHSARKAAFASRWGELEPHPTSNVRRPVGPFHHRHLR